MCLRGICAFSVALSVFAITTSLRAADAPDADGGVALSWHLDAISTAALGPNQPDAAWRRSAAILQAASRLNPSEPRFPRLRVMAMQHVGDTDGSIEALIEYRKLAPADRVAQAQLIGLYAGKLETIDAKITYLAGLLDKENIPVEVRSHVASQCASLLLQKSKPQAADMAQRAVQLYPLPQAIRQYYELVGRDLPLNERVHALLQLLSANPFQPPYLTELGNLLAENGWSEQSLPWYQVAIGLIMRSGPSRPPEFHDLLISYAAQDIIAGHGSDADTLLGQMLDELPLDADAWFLKLTVAQSALSQVAYGQTLELAKSALTRRWNVVHDEVLFGPTATQSSATQPAGAKQPASTAPTQVEPLDPAPVLVKLKESNSEQQKSTVASTLGDLAWFELYYDKQPEAAKRWIDLVAQLLPADSPTLGRLQGWLALQSGQSQQARDIFAKFADKDALSELGILKADEAEKKQLNRDEVNKLLDQNRLGLPGAIVREALRSEKIVPATRAAAEGLVDELKKFPGYFLAMLDPRAVRRVYDVRTDPVSSAVAFGDPILLKLTVINNCDSDVTIGADSLLRPDLWFDARTLGLDQQSFRGVAYDQIGNELVLRAHGSTTQTVRLDAGELRKTLDQMPAITTRITGDTITNPAVQTNGVVPGPGGTFANFSRSLLQTGVSLGTAIGKKQLENELSSTSPADRVRALDLLAAYVRLSRRPDVGEELKKVTAETQQTIDRLRTDSSPIVSGWAGYLSAILSAGDQQSGIVNDMAKSPQWSTRFLSLLVTCPGRKETASRLAHEDPDPTVKAAAAATVEMLEQAATRPSTQPAATSQPIGAGGG